MGLRGGKGGEWRRIGVFWGEMGGGFGVRGFMICVLKGVGVGEW